MKKLVFVILLFCICQIQTTNCYAQWLFDKKENAFDDKKSSYVAFTANNEGYILGVRCIDEALSLKFITVEKVTDSSVLVFMNKLEPKLLFRADKSSITEIAANVDESDDEKLFLQIEDEIKVKDIANEILLSKGIISLAMKSMDKMFHNVTFSNRGAAKAVQRVLDACKK